jgi:hypothetical protein
MQFSSNLQQRASSPSFAKQEEKLYSLLQQAVASIQHEPSRK